MMNSATSVPGSATMVLGKSSILFRITWRRVTKTPGGWMCLRMGHPLSTLIILISNGILLFRRPRFSRKTRSVLPVLGDLYGNVLEREETLLGPRFDEAGFFLRYYEHKIPLDPASYGFLLDECLERIVRVLGQQHESIAEIETHPVAPKVAPADNMAPPTWADGAGGSPRPPPEATFPGSGVRRGRRDGGGRRHRPSGHGGRALIAVDRFPPAPLVALATGAAWPGRGPRCSRPTALAGLSLRLGHAAGNLEIDSTRPRCAACR